MDNRIKKGKVSIIGAGYVGSSISYALVLCDVVNEIVLINRNIEKAKSEINDIRHGFKFVGKTILRVGDYSDISDSDVVVIAIGRNRKDGETRLDLASDNIKIVSSVIPDIKKYYKNSVIVIVTNPIDIITKKVQDSLRLPYGKIIGTGCILDSSRFVRVIADYLKCDIDIVRAMIVGEHGDGQVPIWSNVIVDTMPIDKYCKIHNIKWNEDIKNAIENCVRNMGASIIKNKGRTQYGIATCAADIINAIIYDKKILASVSSEMQGELGIREICLSFPSIIGSSGIEERKKVIWSDNENQLFLETSEKIKDYIKKFN